MEPEKKSNGALIGSVVIVVILIIGGLYLWKQNESVLKDTTGGDESVVSQEDSAELSDLEKDLGELGDEDLNLDQDIESVE